MAGPTVTLVFAGDERRLTNSMRNVGSASRTMQQDIQGVGNGLGSVGDAADESSRRFAGFSAGVTTAAMAVGVGILAMGKQVVDSASEQQQAFGGLDSVFQQSAGQMKAWSEEAAKSVGLSKTEFANLAAPIGASLKTMGFSMEESTGKTKDLITMGADLAATFGGDVSEAVSAISSLMRGEADPIERYGISIKQSDVNARLAAQGLSGLTGEALRNAEATARLAMLQEQSASATGQFAREADSAAGSAAIQKAEFENLKAELGESLLPVISSLTSALTGLTGFMSEHTGVVTVAVLAVGGLAAGVLLVNAAVSAWAAITKVAAVAQIALNFAMSANPIGLLVIALAGLVAAVIYAWRNCEGFRNAVIAVWNAIKTAFSVSIDFIRGRIESFVASVTSIRDRVVGVFSGMANGIRGAFSSAFSGIRNLWNSTVGRLSFSVPSWVPGIGGSGWSVPKMHRGGVVPGRPGTEMLAILQAGETVRPKGRDTVGGRLVVEFSGTTDSAMATAIMKLIRSGEIQLRVA